LILSLRLRLLVLLSALPMFAGSSVAQQNRGISVGVSYTYLRTNPTPDCNCFGLNGGSAELQFKLTPRLALLAELTGAHAGGITANHYDLTQVNYAGGVRYFPASFRRLQPFGDLLLGGAYASGSLSPEATSHGGSNAFLLETGGGFGIAVGYRWTVVPVRASYVLTTFSNGYDDRQNDLRLSAGVRLRLGGH